MQVKFLKTIHDSYPIDVLDIMSLKFQLICYDLTKFLITGIAYMVSYFKSSCWILNACFKLYN